jgi:filamentous hemagglutinin
VLAAANPAGSFAVLPVYKDTLAPYDYFESGSFAPKAGTTVHLDGTAGLPAGEYAVLPARYALLPGAFLVTEGAGLRDRPSGMAGSLRDGTPVVSGYFGVAGTQQHEDRTRGFAVVTAESLRDPGNIHRPAEYTVALASEFFPAHLAEGALLPRMPGDAGVVSISAGKSLDLQAQLQGGAVNHGRGAAVDIASANLVVQAGGATTVTADSVAVSADVLNKLGAESLLLGGTRTDTAQGTRLDIISSNVTLAPDAQLTAPEIMLGAKAQVTLERGAALSGQGATGGGAATYVVQGDAALLRVSGGAQSSVLRDQTQGNTGSINVEAGAAVSAAGSANFDVSSDLTVDRAAHIGVQGASLSVGAQLINLGAVPDKVTGFNLTDSTLNGLDANELQLHGRTAISFYEAPELVARNLVLDAPLIVARSGADASAVTKIEAGQVTLMNSTGKDSLAALPDQLHGQLQVHANNIELGRGNYTVAGFSGVTLDAEQTLMGRDTGALKVTGATGTNQTAQLTLDAGVISGQRGATTHITATGQVNLLASHAAPAALPDNALGASLSIDAAAIRDAARIVMPSGMISLHATGSGGVTVDKAAVLDTSGVLSDFTLTQVATSGGIIELAAEQGDVNVAAGAQISVAGAVNAAGEGAAAGSLTLRAPNGTLTMAGSVDARAGSGQQQGSATVDARHIADAQNSGVAALNATLNSAGFTDQRVLRVRAGNVDDLGDITGQRIDVSVDGANNTGGQLTVTGRLDASGAQGGHVRLAANADILAKAGSLIDAHATDNGQKGGSVELFSTSGRVRTETGSTINVAGGTTAAQQDQRNGELHVRVNAPLLTAYAQSGGAAPVDLRGAVTGTEVYGAKAADLDHNIFVEAALVTHDTGNVTIDSGKIDALQKAAQSFMGRDSTGVADNHIAKAIETRLKNESGLQTHVRPGIEVQADGDIEVGVKPTAGETPAPWDLSTQRYAGQPGYLTLRAKGNLNINQTLTDGFVSDYSGIAPIAGPSWSYRLVAGADLNSAGPFAVQRGAATGSLTLAPGDLGAPRTIFQNAKSITQTAIRTGTGDIEIAAARDVVLANKASVIYTGGVPASGISDNVKNDYLRDTVGFTAAFAQDSGDVTVRAGGDMIGQPSHNLITEWLWRTANSENPTPTAWGVKFDRFADGVGALAGGDVTLEAAGSIKNVSAAIPSYGIPTGVTEVDNAPVVRGGGKLRVTAGQDILGGVYYVGRGQGVLNAGGSVTNANNATLHTVLALGDASLDVNARHDVQIETIFNPTVAPISLAEGQPSEGPDEAFNSGVAINYLSDFFTYRPQSRIKLTSTAGNTAVFNDSKVRTEADASLYSSFFGDYTGLLHVLPPSLYIHSFAGDIELGGGVMFPSAQGQLELLAQGNIRIKGSVVLSDADVSLLPSAERPGSTLGQNSLLNTAAASNSAAAHAKGSPVHEQPAGAPLDPPALIVAQTGDIDMSAFAAEFWLAKSAEVVAGRDLVNPNISVQNVNSTDVTSISAGRDLRYSTGRDATTKVVSQSTHGIAIDGPGDALISAGRDLNLAASAGIVTQGNTMNPALAANGANLSVLAGVGHGPDYDGFIETYLVTRADYRDRLLDYMATRGTEAGTWNDALAAFRALPRDQQMGLLETILFAEVRTAGRSAANSGNGDFSGGYAAIASLFPDAGEQGKLALYFSRIYTLDGGDINLLVPHGDINVGLTAAPDTFGIIKKPEKLGIVAQSSGDVNIVARDDVQVNTSRVFTGDGGSILMWSSQGNIDAGRGAKTAISAPPPVITVDDNGKVTVTYSPALTGSGIRAFVTTAGRKPGDVDLYAPAGVINVNDAGIGSAGNLTIGATQVIGADNIDVAGVSVGVSVVETGALSATLGSVGGAGSSVAKSTEDSLNDSAKKTVASNSPLADSALGFLEVQVLGFGDGDEKTNEERNAKSDDEKKQPGAKPM